MTTRNAPIICTLNPSPVPHTLTTIIRSCTNYSLLLAPFPCSLHCHLFLAPAVCYSHLLSTPWSHHCTHCPIHTLSFPHCTRPLILAPLLSSSHPFSAPRITSLLLVPLLCSSYFFCAPCIPSLLLPPLLCSSHFHPLLAHVVFLHLSSAHCPYCLLLALFVPCTSRPFFHTLSIPCTIIPCTHFPLHALVSFFSHPTC